MGSLADDPRFQRNKRKLDIKAKGGDRIIGGTPVPAGEFMDCVAVGCPKAWFCSGTLIAPNVVVTAAHCVRCAQFVYFGGDVRDVRPNTSHPSVVAVKSIVRHEDYEGGTNDLMVLVLAKRVTVKPRKLATTARIDAANDGRVAGFGLIDPKGKLKHGEKQMVDVPIASPACKGRVGAHSDELTYGCAAGLELVAKAKDLSDTCQGDSGGPFYIKGPRGDWLLAGATSRGTRDGKKCGDGGIYTRLDRYKSWMEEAAGVRL